MFPATVWTTLQEFDTKRLEAVAKHRQRLDTLLATQPGVTAHNTLNISVQGNIQTPEDPRAAERLRWIESIRRKADAQTRLQQEGDVQREKEELRRQKEADAAAKQAIPGEPTQSTTKNAPTKPDAASTIPTPSVTGNSRQTDDNLEKCLQRLQQRDQRSKEVQKLDKGNAALKSIKLFLTMLTNTKRDVRLRLDGTEKEKGPRPLIDFVAKRAPAQLNAAMQVIADRIVHCATSNLAIDALMRGEANYGLVYLTLLICLAHPAFTDILKGSLEAACPFIQPGLKQHVEQEAKINNWSKEVRKIKLGYVEASEGDDEYLFRMQALVGFYSALLQTSPMLLKQYSDAIPYSDNHPGDVTNPLGGLAEAWRWLAKTLNGPKWRWTRFLLHAFLCVSGRDLSLALPKQMTKVLELMQSEQFKSACEATASHPTDDDRIRGFETFVSESLKSMKKDGALKGPGKFDEVDGKTVWVDPRELPEGAIDNVG